MGAALALMLAGCGGSGDKARGAEPAAAVTPPAEPTGGDQTDEDDDGLEVQGLHGHLEPAEIQAGVAPHQRKLARCYQAEQRRRRFLTGVIKLKFMVLPDGSVDQAQVVDSTLGSWPVEKCVLGIARAMHFARPQGGDHKTDFTVPLDFESGRGRIEVWEEARIDAQVTQHRAELDSCAGDHPAPSGVTVTLYIGNHGQVKEVGFGSSGDVPLEDAWADCAADVVAGWKMPDPLGVIAKTSFSYR